MPPGSSSRPPTSRPSSRSRSGSGPLLDPYGIYGTRNANRMRSMRRRRQTQNVVLLLLIVGIACAGAAGIRFRRKAAVRALAQVHLLSPVAEKPVLARISEQEASFILVATADGRLLRLNRDFDNETQANLVLDTAFPLHTPLVRKGTAFVPCEDGALYAVDWKSGKKMWRTVLGAPLTARPALVRINTPASAAAPLPSAAGTPVVGAPAASAPPPVQSSVEAVIAAADDGLLVALRAGNGKALWRTRLPAPIGEGITVSNVAGAAPRLLVPLLGNQNMRGGVWCLDAASGKVLWRFPRDRHVEATQIAAPVADESAGRVFIGSDAGAVFCIGLRGGEYDPQKKIGWKSFAPAVVRDPEALVSWRASPVLFFGNGSQGTATRLVAGGNDGGLRCFAARDGGLLWQFKANGPVISLQKLVADGQEMVLVGTRSEAAYLINVANGERVRRFNAGGILSGVALVGQDVVTVTTDGVVQRFPAL